MENKRNLLNIEILRIAATFFVIFNHSESNGFGLFIEYPVNRIQYWIYLSISILCKVAVPLFLMISGAVLLKKDYPLKILWKKKIMHLVIVLLVFSFVYYIWFYPGTPGSDITLSGFFKRLYVGNINYTYWFLYAHLSLLISLPFLRAITKGLSGKHYLYLIGLTLVFRGIIPAIQTVVFWDKFSINESLNSLWIVKDLLIWPLIGYYCENIYDINKITLRKIVLMGVLSFAAIAISCLLVYSKYTIAGTYSENGSFYSALIVIPCITIYLSVKFLFVHIHLSTGVTKFITSFGESTFGIYLVHLLILKSNVISALWGFFHKQLHMNYMISAITICMIVMLIGYVIVLLAKQLSGIRNWLS